MPAKLLIPDEGRITPAKVDQLLNYSSLVTASNLKFDVTTDSMRHNKSLSIPYGVLSDSGGKPPFSPLVAKGGRSL